MITIKVIALSAHSFEKSFEKKKIVVRKYFLSENISIGELRKAGAPDGVEVDEDEDEDDVDVVVVDPDVHVCCDMPMSIYSQHFFYHFCK